MKIPVWNGELEAEDKGGPGVPLVLIHAFPLHKGMWEAQAPLAKQARLISYDIRGFGASQVADAQIPFELHVDDLFAVLDRLELSSAVLCGLSMGGYIALRAAERAPERIKGLILADTKTEADGNEAKLKRAATVLAIKKDGLEKFIDGFLKSALAPDAAEKNPAAVKRVRELSQVNKPEGVCGALLAMAARTDTAGALAKVKVPALVIVGEKDGLTPPTAAKAMADAMTTATLEILPGAGHLSNLESPDAFNRAVGDYLKRF